MTHVCIFRFHAVGSIDNARSHDLYKPIGRSPSTRRQFRTYRRIHHWVLPRVYPFGSTTIWLDCSSWLLWKPHETTIQVISIYFTWFIRYSSTRDVSFWSNLDHILIWIMRKGYWISFFCRFTTGFVLLYRKVDGNDYCSWCHYLSCMPTPLWSCDPQCSVRFFDGLVICNLIMNAQDQMDGQTG